ncbi:unnamed protein product [Vitrella brassicaformis CCMP3155]|uniref:Uncharacterized protein n=1 Tax=Vitrella brassicaformis (strain CCMP3155) TaxID=1169540 RepID=A0A0G4G2W5_VITBC|nr:unnamed protein product [Vitrella brassicaformis CCMP3155]|eukprot:CEM22049.1 unnamed protein product [Vitrella brassicaformis CCMP3155]
MDREDVVASLLSLGLSHHISKQDDVLKTPLHAAAQVGNAAVTNVLIEAADPSALAIQDNVVTRTKSTRIYFIDLILFRRGKQFCIWLHSVDGSTALHLSIDDEAIDVTRLLSTPESISCKGSLKLTPLQCAMAKGRWRHVDAMLDVVIAARPISRASTENIDQHDDTVLQRAVFANRAFVLEQIVGYLRENDIMHIIRTQDEDGKSPLHHAAANGNTECIRLLLPEGNIKTKNKTKKRTPLHEAAAFGNPSPVEELLKHADKEALLSQDDVRHRKTQMEIDSA